MTTTDFQFLATLESIIADRQSTPTADSYTSSLFAAGPQRIAQKVGEEAIEVALAATSQARDQVIAESADLVYHLLVLLAARNIPLAEVIAALQARHDA